MSKIKINIIFLLITCILPVANNKWAIACMLIASLIISGSYALNKEIYSGKIYAVITYPFIQILYLLFSENEFYLEIYLKVCVGILFTMLFYSVGYGIRNEKELILKLSKIICGILIMQVLIDKLFEYDIYSRMIDSEDKTRVYLFSYYFFTFLALKYYYKNNLLIGAYFSIPGLLTNSKINFLILTLAISILIFKKISAKNMSLKEYSLIIIYIYALTEYSISSIRILEFLENGDSWRAKEIEDYIEFIKANPFSVIFGNGAGFSFRNLNLIDVSDSLLRNSNSSIHNIILDLIMKFGLVYLAVYARVLAWMISGIAKTKNEFYYYTISYLLIGMSAPTLLYSLEAVTFFFFMGIFNIRARSKRENYSKNFFSSGRLITKR